MNYGSVILSLQRATHATLHLVDLDIGLTPSEINALGNLSDRRPRTVTELGAAIGSRPATLTGILDRLERRGLISREARPGDRRSVVIALTPSGVRAAGTVRVELERVERDRVGHLDAAAIAGFHAVIDALIDGGQR